MSAAAPRKQPPVNPITGWPLKAHQRLATKQDAAASWKSPGTQRGSFPSGGQWELIPANVLHWLRHDFAAMRSETQHLAAADLNSDEFALLLWDLTLWWAKAERWLTDPTCTPPPPVPWLYLQPGRDHWGMLGILAESITFEEEESRDAARTSPPSIVADTRREEVQLLLRDNAMLVLSLLRLKPADLVDLDVGDVDAETQTVCLRYSAPEHPEDRTGRLIELWDEAWYALESYLDLLPELDPAQPLFPSREGRRMSVSQARRIIYNDELAPLTVEEITIAHRGETAMV